MASCTVVQEAPRTSEATSPLREPRRSAHSFAAVAGVVVALLGFGLLGLLMMIPPLRHCRRRHAATCPMCGRHQRLWLMASTVLALVTLCGGLLRATQDRQGSPRCQVSAISMRASYETVHEPSDGATRSALHTILNASASGLAVAFVRGHAQAVCDADRPSLTLGLVPRALYGGGSTIGDVFVTPLRLDLDAGQLQALVRHESHHSDQWAVATALGGISLLPVAYLVDESLYPADLNHFEQAAGLAEGGYSPVPDPRPGPRPWALAGWSLCAASLLRRRVRLLVRTIAGRARPCGPHRCAFHTPGW